MSEVGKTLNEWNAQQGDVFYYHAADKCGRDREFKEFTPDGRFHALDSNGKPMANSKYWHLVSRAKATPHPDYNDGKWHGWNGGECPVHPESVVNVAYVDNDLSDPDTEGGKSSLFLWSHNGVADIVAFRVTKEHKDPREFWVNPYTMEAAKEAVDHYIHVREVMK